MVSETPSSLKDRLAKLNHDTDEAGLPAFVPALFLAFGFLLSVGLPLNIVHNFVWTLPESAIANGLLFAVFIVFNILHLWFLYQRKNQA